MSTRDERQRAIDAAVFRTITGEDWRREIAAAREAGNTVAARIREKLSKMKVLPNPGGEPRGPNLT